MEIKRWSFIFLVCCILIILTVYGCKFFGYRNSIAKETSVRQYLEIGEDIETARTKLQDNGFNVTEIETRRGFGTKVMLINLVEPTFFDYLEYNLEIDMTPFSAEPNHWIVVTTSPGSDTIASVESK